MVFESQSTLFKPNFFIPDNQDHIFAGYDYNLHVIFIYVWIHGREKKSWYSSMGGKGYCHGCTDQKAVTEVEPTSHGVWRRGRTNTLKIKGKLFPRWFQIKGRRPYQQGSRKDVFREYIGPWNVLKYYFLSWILQNLGINVNIVAS